MKHKIFAGGGAVGLVVLVFSALRASAAAPTTSMQLMPGTVAPQVAHASVTGQLPADRMLSLTLTLRPRDPAGLAAFDVAVTTPGSPLFRRFITPAQFAQRFGPAAVAQQSVERFLQAAGLHLDGVEDGGVALRASGTAQQIAAAFQVRLNTYRASNGRVFFANDRDITLPANLASVIATVVGLDDARQWHRTETNTFLAQTHLIHRSIFPHASCPPADGSVFLMSQMARMYNYPAISASGQHMALLEMDGYATSDISAFAACAAPGVNAANVVRPRLVDTSSPLPTGSGAVEDELDIEIALGLVPSLGRVDVYEAPNTGTGWMDLLAAIAGDNTDGTVSISWGSCEADTGAQWAQAENVYFQQMVAQGQDVFDAAGDTGAYDCLPNDGSGQGDREVSVDDPASDPNLVAVGGTTLTTPGTSYGGETAWNNYPTDGFYAATGGGASKIWSAPAWQISAKAASASSARLVPDVASVADPDTSPPIYCSVIGCSPAGWYAFGGTSAAAPTWAALASLADAQAGKRNGLITPALYNLYAADTAGTGVSGVSAGGTVYYDYAQQVNGAQVNSGTIVFHDITGGTNSFPGFATGFSAKRGYDQVTGLGSMNGQVLADYLAALNGSAPSPPPPSNSLAGTYLVAQGSNKAYWISAALGAGVSQPFANGNWQQIDPLTFQGPPAIASAGGGAFWIAGVGADGTVRVGTWHAAAPFGGWSSVPGISCQGSPAEAYAQGTLFVTCMTRTGGIVINALNTTWNTWGGWAQIGGGLTTAPTMATDGTHLLILAQAPLFRGDQSDWYTLYTIGSGVTTQWRRFMTTCQATPAVAYRGVVTNDYAINCIAGDTGGMWSNILNASASGSSLSGWINLGTPGGGIIFHSATAVTSDRASQIYFIGLGTNNAVYLATLPLSGTGRASWQRLSLPGIFAGSASADYFGG